ncbi:MAG: transglycosylase SLT domain-containing protein [Thiobacillus sp.]|nr:transglycosylase SLT domain-containing protein [Thiobacillus sp.]
MSTRILLFLLLASLFPTAATYAANPADEVWGASAGVSISYDTTLESVTAPKRVEDDLWQRLRAGMALAELDSPLVDKQENWFLDRPAYLDAAFKRARLYLYHIVEAVEARHLPMEIALLPVVESAYNPRALSRSNASGIWQFIPSTGKVYGLKQNGWYDGRQDVVTATGAALDYLAKLHDMFGNWELALAAYNCGEGCVTRAIARNQARGLATDYLSLDLPTETRNYVPRLLAVSNLVREPERHGITLDTLPNRPYFQQVTLPYPIEATTAARLAGVDMDELLDLNPGFRRHVLHSESQQSLLLPIASLDTFRNNLDAEESRRIRLRSYSASKGELLTQIADRFDVTVKWLQDHNPLSLKRGKITQAQTLMLPPSATKVSQNAVPVTLSTPPSARKPVPRATVRTHTVRRGDTLFGLAKRYKVTVADIREYNGSLKVLRPGTKLHIPLDS